MQSTKSLLNKFRSDLFDNTGIKLDFRKYQYIDNSHGLYPNFSYEEGKTIIEFLYKWAHDYIKENEDNYPHFRGWEYNLQMSVEELRTTKLKHYIENICHDLFINHKEKYRREGNKIFKYCPDNRAYIYSHTVRYITNYY